VTTCVCGGTSIDKRSYCRRHMPSWQHALEKLCESWFHATCQKINDDSYAFLKKNESTHWYCEICNHGVGKILQSLVRMSKRQDLLEEQMQKVSQEVQEMREDMKMMKETAKETEVKLDTAIEAKLIDTVGSAVKAQVDDHFQTMNSQLSSVNTTLDQVRSRAIEERDRENRAANVILYNIDEASGNSREDRWRADRKFCLELFNKVLSVEIKEEDMKRFLRLGKPDDSARAPRPVLIQFRDRVLKNMIMESLYKLRDAEDVFKRVIFAHDLTKEKRQECKQLVTEAKKRQDEDESEEFLYRVRGTPGNIRIHKIRKRTFY